MGAVILAENFYHPFQFDGHVVAGSNEPAGHEAWRVGDGRRSPLDFWTSGSANTDQWVEVACDRTRGADVLVLDRGHNLAGETVKLQGSFDDFATFVDVLSQPVPSVVGGTLHSLGGAVTEDGAWIVRFDFQAFPYWRLFIPAMGAGLRPEVVGLWLGLSWEADHAGRKPWMDDRDRIDARPAVTDAGWRGTGREPRVRQGSLKLRLSGFHAYDEARYHLHGRYGDGAPTWFVPDPDDAWKAICIRRPAGTFGFRFEADWAYRSGTINFVEHEPLRTR